ncbi:alpha/beta hydrolase family protein [Massilia consociata]|uniref:Alpha/beta hydrolase family protein n=1 Tax=Massilia consociata TaxID=760117 RepID=A0ABV6FCK7_9BURK
MKSILFGLAALLAMPPAHAEDAAGHWKGRIANSLDVLLQFDRTTEGQWQGTMAVPQQAMSTKVDQLQVTEEQVSFRLVALNAGYAARWNQQGKVWEGTWTQQGRTVPLVLARTDADARKPKRPQEDAIAARAPGYTSSEVSFANTAAGLTLAGSFSVPHGKGPFPAVVLVHGSGPVERNANVFEHKLFLVLADHLTRKGIAVLRYDKRGIGKSTGTYKDATTFDFAGDAEAAVQFLRSRPDVAPGRIGILGHSEGGLIAPLVAARDPGLAFVVMLAAPGVRGELLMAEQIALGSKANGMPEDQIAGERAFHRALLAALASEQQLDLAIDKARQVADAAERDGTLPAGVAKRRLQQLATPWFHPFLRHEPGPVLRSLRQPVLVLNGERDMQVPAAMNLGAIRTALKDNPRAVVQELPKLNHLFQTAPTGAVSEYFTIEESFAPAALDTVSNWILATVK